MLLPDLFFHFLFNLLFLTFAADDVPKNNFEGKILGGKTVPIEEYPYQISLRYMNNHLCGASILERKYVITAAHCTKDLDSRLLSVKYGIASLEEDGNVIPVKTVHQHPKFNFILMDYDLSVLELAEDIEFSERALPIDMVDENKSFVGQLGVVTGWGVNSENGGKLNNSLQAVEIPVLDQKVCKQEYKFISPISPRMFCAGFQGGKDVKDACQGDSGGPFVINGELVGVVSWGWGCGQANYPGVYANISAMKDFVYNVVKK